MHWGNHMAVCMVLNALGKSKSNKATYPCSGREYTFSKAYKLASSVLVFVLQAICSGPIKPFTKTVSLQSIARSLWPSHTFVTAEVRATRRRSFVDDITGFGSTVIHVINTKRPSMH